MQDQLHIVFVWEGGWSLTLRKGHNVKLLENKMIKEDIWIYKLLLLSKK